MPPFSTPNAVISGVKERVESLSVQGDRLYVGTATGTLHVYNTGSEGGRNAADEPLVLLETRKSLTRKAIEQLGFVQDVNSLVTLSEMQVTLFPLPNYAPPTPLVRAKAAFSFVIFSFIQNILPDGGLEKSRDKLLEPSKATPAVMTLLVVGCRRKLVIYPWKDGEAQDAKECPLPHSPRVMVFLNNTNIGLAYSPTEYAIFNLETMIVTDIALPLATTTSVTGMGAFSGLTGYMTLGLGAKSKIGLVKADESEALVVKDNQGLFIGVDTKLSRPKNLDWLLPPEEVAFVKPYILSILPPGSVSIAQPQILSSSSSSPPPMIQTTALQIRSSVTLLPVQTVLFPFNQSPPGSTTPPPANANCLMRLMTTSPSSKPPLYLITTPIDRAAATAEGSTVWRLSMRTWAEQIDELVTAGLYHDALALLEVIESSSLSDKDQRRAYLRALDAVTQFRSNNFNRAIDTFIELDVNPAKVVALYPPSVAGRLSTPQDAWIPLFGGPGNEREPKHQSPYDSLHENTSDKPLADLLDDISGVGIITGKLKTGLGAILPGGGGTKDDDTTSISDKRKLGVHGDIQVSIETLLRYLSDRRPKVAGALAAVKITPAQSHKLQRLSDTSVQELFSLPNAPLSALTPEQLVRFAQIVDTALFKSYLVIRPGLLGPLCRVANWCEVSEVEEELQARGKYAELIFLYNGKNMHAKALQLLQKLSEKEIETLEKLMPSVQYLQKLGPDNLSQIFESSRWIFDQSRDIALEIFTHEDSDLPRREVADYLQGIDPLICMRFLEYLIEEQGEVSEYFHDRLAGLYLSITLNASKSGKEERRQETYNKLLNFIQNTQYFSVDRLYGIISTENLFEARAILLGRLGRHDQALEMYVYRLQNYGKAEEYCKHIYISNSETDDIFLTLLRIYLQPSKAAGAHFTADLLQPALGLISRHAPRIDSVETLKLLPPLVTARAVRPFLIEALRVPLFDARVVREISKSENDRLAWQMLQLQAKRVKVNDSRICPQCHKRIGNSVIAVHAPRGEVTHYQCREAFSKRLNEIRR